VSVLDAVRDMQDEIRELNERIKEESEAIDAGQEAVEQLPEEREVEEVENMDVDASDESLDVVSGGIT